MQVIQTQKYRWLWRFTYLIKNVLLKVLGPRRTLKIMVRGHWLLRRIAFEVSGLHFGDHFQNQALGLSEELLFRLISSDDSVADLGCGTGRWSRASATKAREVFGIDSDAESLAIAESLGGDIHYLKLDLDSALSEMPEVDFSLLVHFLEHIQNPAILLDNLRKKSKRIVIEVPDFESDPLNYARVWMQEPFYFDGDHLREFSLTELLDLLAVTNWTPIYTLQKGGTILVVAE
jgi:SAM-dependent methyltransferase